MADEFLTTRWSMVVAAAGDDSLAGSALDHLLRDAWRPLYAFARRWGCTREDAEDAVQGFLAALLARRSLSKFEPGRGKFRSYLLAGMSNHMRDIHSHARAKKRGGGAEHLSLDFDAVERGYAEIAAETDTPERAFDRMWALEVMGRARAKLAEECSASGKAAVFAALFPENGEGDMAAGAAAAAGMGLGDSGFRALAMRLRRRWRDLIRSEISQTVSTREALDDEMAALRAALA